MSKRGKINQSSQPSSQQKSKELWERGQKEKEAKLLENVEIKKKIAEYEELIDSVKKQLEQNEHEFEIKHTEIINQLNSDHKEKLDQIAKEHDEILAEREQIAIDKEELINSIKASEESLRENYRLELDSKWNTEFQTIRDELRDKQEAIDQALDNSRQEAHEVIKNSVKERDRLLEETRKECENIYKQKSVEIGNRLTELENKEKLLKSKQHEIDILMEDLDEDKKNLFDKRAILNKAQAECSPVKLAELSEENRGLQQIIEFYKQRNDELNNKILHLQKFVNNDDTRTVENIIDELKELEVENRKLKDNLANVPSEYDLNEMRGKASLLEDIKIKLEDEQRQRIAITLRAEGLRLGVIELEQAKRTSEILNTLNEQLQNEISKLNDMYKTSKGNTFGALLQIDEFNSGIKVKKQEATNKTLKQIATHIVNYGASDRSPERLYYSVKTVQRFIASMAASRLIILEGLSGTGKSSLPELICNALGAKHHSIAVQPSWRDNRELLGYYNDFTNKFRETEFTKCLYTATSVIHAQNIWLIVLDEMNLSRIEYYFADFLSVLEKDQEKWIVDLISSNVVLGGEATPKNLIDNQKIKVTPNVWFVGTANKDDSTQDITDKVYDRALMQEFKEREEDFDAKCTDTVNLSFSEFDELIENAKKKEANQLTSSDWETIKELDKSMKKNFNITFGNRIKKQIKVFVPVYIACGGTKEEALDYLISTKVLRKLDGHYEPYLKDRLKDLTVEINLYYGNNSFTDCLEYIDRKLRELGC